ncbi:MAG TPA: glycosyltransferase family 4 protein [Bacteroidia bacterium]|nr:glycosyltransferase family 4 protein [Bacteroidia bacterium]
MKVVNVITPHFPPEVTAAAHRLEALVGTLGTDYKVNVFTLTEIGENANTKEVQLNDNITIYYTNLPRYNKSLFFIRAIFECVYAFRIAFKAARKRADLTLATTPYMFLIPAVILAGSKSRKIMDVRDLVWCYLPEKNMVQRLVKAGFTRMVRYFLGKYDFITVTNSSEEQWVRREAVVPEHKVRIISNGISEDKFKRLSTIKYSQPENPFVITYIGNIGNGQDLNPILEAVKGISDIKLNLIGDGIELEDFKRKVKTENLRNVRLHGKLKWSRLLPFYQTSTILFARLGKNYQSAIPSKLFEYLSTGLPVIFSGSGEAAKLLRQFENTFVLESEDPAALRQLILQIKTLPLTRSFENILKIEDLFIRERINQNLLPVIASLIHSGQTVETVQAVEEFSLLKELN